MHLCDLLWIALFATLTSGEQEFTAVNPMLDPNRIFWWRSKWAPGPIQLSSNNQGAVSTANFYFSPSTSMTNCVFEVAFPSSFSAKGERFYQQTGLDLVAGQDYMVSVPWVRNPESPGAYGPFALRTRFSPRGQQVDVNLNFGVVYITGAASRLSNFSVSIGGASTAVNQSGNTLSFKFSLGVSLWRFDSFVVSVDPKWTVGVGADCYMADVAGRWNNFNGSNADNPHALQCVVAPKSETGGQTVFVYGLAVVGVDATVSDNQVVDLRIASVTTPDSVYTSFNWGLSITRFGTATTLEQGTACCGPVVSPGAIVTASWAPTWAVAQTDLAVGGSYFMDLSFTVTNAIPAGGSVLISVTEDVSTGDSNWAGPNNNCYLVTFLSTAATCRIAAGHIALSTLPAVSAGTSITLRNIVKPVTPGGSVRRVNSITTYTASPDSGLMIDSGTNLASYTIMQTSSLLQFGMAFHSSQAATFYEQKLGGGSGDSSQAIQFYIRGALQSSSTVVISCPLAASMDDFSISLPQAQFAYQDSSLTSAEVMHSGRVSIPGKVTLGSAQRLGTISPSAVSVSLGLHLLVFSLGTAEGCITLPRVSNNLATAYECYAKVQSLVGAVRFVVAPQTFTTQSFALPCWQQERGIPGVFKVRPAVFSLPANTQTEAFYVEIQINSRTLFVQGMLRGDDVRADSLLTAIDYPVASLTAPSATGKYYPCNGANCIAVTNLPAVPSFSPDLVLVAPIDTTGLAPSQMACRFRSYYVLSADPRFKFVYHESVFQSLTYPVLPSTLGFSRIEAVDGSNSVVNGGNSEGLKLSVVPSETLANESYLYFVFPPEVAWLSTKSVVNTINDGTAYSNAWFFSASKQSLSTGVLISSLGATSHVPSLPMAGTIVISGFTLPLGSGTHSVRVTAGMSGSACLDSAPVTVNSLAGAITSLRVSPDVIKARGPDGINVNHTVSFTLQHGIPLGGRLSLSVSSDWTFVDLTTCAVSGFPPAAQCIFAGTTVVVAGFRDFAASRSVAVSVALAGLLPPVAIGDAIPLLTIIETATESGAVIDTLASSQYSLVTVRESSARGTTTWLAQETFPPVVGAKNVNLYLQFTLQHSLPTNALITISSPLSRTPSGDLENVCFLSPLAYKRCLGTGGRVELKLGQDYTAGAVLELFLESAGDNPSVPVTFGFTAFSAWAGVVVDSDVSSSTSYFTVAQPPNAEVFGRVDFAPKTAGELATYSFSIKITTHKAAEDQIWLAFPCQFDYFLGDAWTWFSAEPDTYYLECDSVELGAALCSVNHGVVVVTGRNGVPANTQIVIRLNGVVNPPQGSIGPVQVHLVNVR